MRYGVKQTEFFVILDHFLPFYKPKIQNFENMKKTPIIPKIMLRWCTVSEIEIILSFFMMFRKEDLSFFIMILSIADL